MDGAVGLVQTYLRVNGYFTVAEYPIVEFRGGFQEATDVDVMGFRFPAATRLVPHGDGRGDGLAPFTADPTLQVPDGKPDMIVGEVKEGRAGFNRAGRRPEVLATALARFGCCPLDDVDDLASRVLDDGQVVTPHGHAIRMVAFGSLVGSGPHPYLTISLGHVTRFLQSWLEERWELLRHAQLKDPVLAFMATLMKADEGGSSS